MKVLVSGDRNYSDWLVVSMLTGLYQEESCGYLTVNLNGFVVIHGACTTGNSERAFFHKGMTGADGMAAWWAEQSPFHAYPTMSWVEYENITDACDMPDYMPVIHRPFPADWKQYGKAAGPIRNKQMLDEGQPDLVLCFHDDIEKSKGTKNMYELAKARGIKTKLIGG